jgi:predicted lactoylglutathione lyase
MTLITIRKNIIVSHRNIMLDKPLLRVIYCKQSMPFYQMLKFKPWLAHSDTQRFGFCTTGNRAVVVVRQKHQRKVYQFRIKDAFAATVKIIAVPSA